MKTYAPANDNKSWINDIEVWGYDPHFKYEMISDNDLSNPLFMVDAIASIRERVIGLPHRNCSDFYMDLHRDLDGYFADGIGEEIIFGDELAETDGEWWRDTIQTPEPRTEPLRVRSDNKERIRIILSIHRACYPAEAALWGVRPANDK